MGNLFIFQCVILIILALRIEYSQGLWPPTYKVDLKDKQTFLISSDEDYDENEDEMIQPRDLSGIESLKNDETKFEALHSHVENYNRQINPEEENPPRNFTYHPIMESNLKDEPEPFIAGFKQELDKYEYEKQENSEEKRSLQKLFSKTAANKNSGYVKNDLKRIKRSDEESLELIDSSTEFFEGLNNGNSTTEEAIDEENEETDLTQSQITELSTTEKFLKVETTNSKITEGTTLAQNKNETNSNQTSEKSAGTENSKDYDYDQLKAEYDQQIKEMFEKKEMFNYTDKGEPEETAKDAVKKIVDFKMPRNCTTEELSQIGAKTFECLMYDYQHAKNKTDVNKIFRRTWKVVKIWIYIYILFAIPCWCQKGWCCCCFCCEFCFPQDMIEAEKKYFVENPPGVLVQKIREDGIIKVETEEYKATLFEYDAYEELKSQIRNI